MQRFTTLAAAGALLAAVTSTASAQVPAKGDVQQQRELRQKFDRRQEGELKVGDLAPDFALQDLQGQTTVRLAELRGKPVVLVFGSCT
jgi:cytochrome oxidase Cu insertion factor (SCO1/SenC/PrrC family)